MRAVIVEFAVYRPEFLAQRNPIVRHVVTNVVFLLWNTKHGYFAFVPASDDIEAKSAPRNMINRCHLLSGADGMNSGHMERREDADLFGFGGEARCPGKCFEIAMIEVHFAAHAFPAGNWNDGLDTRCFRQPCDRDGFLPIDFKRIGAVRHRASAADIETEHAQFEFVWAAFQGVYWG